MKKGVGASWAAKRIISCVNLLLNLKKLRYRESLVTLGKNIYILQDLNLPSTVCTSDFFRYLFCHNICFRMYWLIIIFHFSNGMLLKYHFILDVISQLEIWEVFQNGWKHKSLPQRILLRNNRNFADVLNIPDFLAFIRLCIPLP